MQEKLHHIHIAILIYMIQSAAILFQLPRLTAQHFGTNGWLILIVISLTAMLNIWLISIVYRLGHGQSIFQILQQTIPKFMLYPCYVILALFWSHLAALVGKDYMFLIQLSGFPTVSTNMLLFLTLTLAFLLLIKGIYNIVKATVIFFYMTIWTVALLGFHLEEFRFRRMTSFLFQGDTNMVEGFFEVYTAFLGYELVILLFPYVHRTTRLFKGVYIGNLITTTTYLGVSIVSFGFFSFGQLNELVFPTLTLMKFIETPVIERLENLVFSLFLLKTLVTVVLFYWGAQELMRQVFPKVNPSWIGLALIGSSFITISFLRVYRDVNRWFMLVGKIEVVIAFSLPLVLITILAIQNRKKVTASG